MYFNDNKPRLLGIRIEGGKLKKKIHKSLDQLKKHDPDVKVSEDPTENLFVSNSSILCSVSPEELEVIFSEFDENCSYIVYPNKRSYSFVSFSSKELAVKARSALHGLVPPQLTTSHQPFIISFVENLPGKRTTAELAIPNDLVVLNDFIDEKTEKEIVDVLLNNSKLSSLKHRSVAHFIHEFDYGTNGAAKVADPAPPIVDELITRLLKEGLLNERPDQITANVYQAGHGIPSHYDTHSAFEDPVISLSMLSDVVMEFKDGANSARIVPVLLKQRSLCIIQGESRYRWKHGIVNRKFDVDPSTNRMMKRQLRVSLTFRKIRKEPCQCSYKEFCDWDRQGEMSVPSDDALAKRLEDSYVSSVYENISSHFDETRHSNWKAVQSFIDSLPRFSTLFDVGCGNGKYLISNDNLIKMGCDMCQGLCQIAKSKNCSVVRADALHLPFREGVDAIICIAVLHHMSSIDRRRKLVKEIVRLLRPGGRACITVWSMDQSDSEYARMRNNKEDVGESENVSELSDATSRLKVHDGKTFVQQDVLVPWVIDSQNETFLRFYHVFREGEMEELIRDVDGCQLDSVVKEQGNYIALLTKQL